MGIGVFAVACMPFTDEVAHVCNQFVKFLLHVEGMQCSAPSCSGWPHHHYPLFGTQNEVHAPQHGPKWIHNAALGSCGWPC